MSANIHTVRTNFNGGEITPLLEHRADAEKVQTGCRVLENFIVLPQGGIAKRPGTQFIGLTKDPTGNARLFGFRRSTEVNYILEFGEGYLCIWIAGNYASRQFLNATPPAWVGSASSGAWVTATSYVVGNQITSKGTVFRCTSAHTSGASTEPSVGDDWPTKWIEIPYYEIGDLVTNTGYYYCKTRHYPSAAFASDAAHWFEMTLGAELIIPTPYQADEVFDLQFTQLNDVLFIAHPNHHPKRLSRMAEDHWIIEDMPWDFAPALDVNEDNISVQVNFDGVPQFGVKWAVTTNYEVGDRVHGIDTSPNVQGFIYECIEKHTSSAGDEPGSGSWATYWTLISNTGYAVGSRVTAIGDDNPYFNEVFTCHTAYLPTNAQQYSPGIDANWKDRWNKGTSSVFTPDWASNKNYVVGNKVRQGAQVYLCRRNHKSAAPTNSSGKNPGTKGNKPGVSDGWTRTWQRIGSDNDLSGFNYRLDATADLFSTDDVGTTWILEIGARTPYVLLAAPSTEGEEITTEDSPLFIQGGYTFSTGYATGSFPVAEITLEESLDNEQWQAIRQWSFQDANENANINYSGDTPSVGAWYRLRIRKLTGATSVRKVKLEATSSVFKLPFQITEYVDAAQVKGRVVMPDGKYPPANSIGVATSIFRRPAFSPTNGYPRTVAFHDSRLWWGGTNAHPTRMWASQTEDYYIYLTGTLDTDGLDLTLAAIEANEIQWLASFNRALVVGTSGDEWTVDSGETDQAITPTNSRARRRTRYGSNGIPPQLTGDSLLWLGRNGRSIYEFAYDFQSDSFKAPDMTLLAEHILGDGMVQMDFQRSISPILWCVLNNGQLAGLSYNREQNVIAWHRQTTIAGEFKSVATIYGDKTDEVWMVVKRGNNHCIERFHPQTMAWIMGAPDSILLPNDDLSEDHRWKYLDSHISTCNWCMAFPHLAGQYVAYCKPDGETSTGVYLVDGDGNIPIPGYPEEDSLSAIYGIPIVANALLPKFDVPFANGTSLGRKMRFNRMIPFVWKSRGGGWFLIDDSRPLGSAMPLTPEVFPFDYERIIYSINPLGDFLDSFGFLQVFWGQLQEIIVNGNFNHNARLVITSRDHYPMTILGLVLKIEISGD